nr:YaaC family protein [Mesorhizobium sp. SARCC-RB16n]
MLLYYGVVSLSRGLTLILKRGLREAALAPSHGLSVLDWGHELSRDNPDFAALAMSVNASGTFMDVSDATGFRSLLRGASSVVNETYVNPRIPAGAVIGLGDLLSRQPALVDHHMRWRGETRCLQSQIEGFGERGVIKFHKGRPWVNRANAEAVLQGTEFAFELEDAVALVFVGPNRRNALPGLTDYARAAFLNIGDLWLPAQYRGRAKLSKLSALYALSYALGMLVRYYPMQWSALVKGQINDAALPTLAAAVELIESEFPTTVLDFLEFP